MKRCPSCAEEIQDAAILCRYCGADLLPPNLRDLAHRWSTLSDKGRAHQWGQLDAESQAALRAYLESSAAAGPGPLAARRGSRRTTITKPAGCAMQLMGAPMAAVGLLLAFGGLLDGRMLPLAGGLALVILGGWLFVLGRRPAVSR
jgi:hypothetical protein